MAQEGLLWREEEIEVPEDVIGIKNQEPRIKNQDRSTKTKQLAANNYKPTTSTRTQK